MILGWTTRPNRLKDVKNEKYHSEFARWAAWNGMCAQWYQHQQRIAINRNFYSPNRQWCLEEDIEGFLRDESGNVNSRIRAEINMIQIMGNQYIGNANSMNITYKVGSISPMSKTRKEEALAQLLYWQQVSEHADPQYKEYLKKKMLLGDTAEATTGIFENFYVDQYCKSMTGMLTFAKNINKFPERIKPLAEQCIISGMSTMKPVVSANDYRFKQVFAPYFFFDRDALEYDLSDANYMGEFWEAVPTDLYELYGMGNKEVEKIESYLQSNPLNQNGRIRVYRSCWRDILNATYAYVKDEFGEINLHRINTPDNEGGKVLYTDKDVVDVNELTEYQRTVVNKRSGKAKKDIYCDQWRFCDFIPAEIIGAYSYANYDMELDYGVVPFQQPNIYSLDNMMPPYMNNFYMYLFGDVYSPVDVAINPQRMVNRIMAVVENVMNHTPLTGPLYDIDGLGDEDEAAAINKIKNGDPLGIRGQGMPIQNKVGMYGMTSSPAAERLTQMAEIFVKNIQNITGVNSAMEGQEQGADQLVGVMQLMIKKGTVTQERFYDCIQNTFAQMYQNLCTSGKRFYIQNKSVLANAVGDQAADVIVLSEDMNQEEFRCFIKRTMSEEESRKNVDSLALQFFQAQLLDKSHLGNVLGRASEDELYSAVREFLRESIEVEKEMQKQAQAQAQQDKEEAKGLYQEQVAREDAKDTQQIVENEKDRLAKHTDNLMTLAGQNQQRQQVPVGK